MKADSVPRATAIVYRRNGSVKGCRSMEQSEKTFLGEDKVFKLILKESFSGKSNGMCKGREAREGMAVFRES